MGVKKAVNHRVVHQAVVQVAQVVVRVQQQPVLNVLVYVHLVISHVDLYLVH